MRFRAGNREYELQGRLGDGAVGLVRKAKALESGVTVAVKLLAPDPKYIEVDAFQDVADRFRREGQRGAGLRHENLVEIIAYEDNNNGEKFDKREIENPFLVMEYVRGVTLESLINQLGKESSSSIITRQKLTIALRIAEALLYLHERKIVHRDVKPANVFLSTSQPGSIPSVIKLGDFGVTKWGDFLSATVTGMLTVTSQQGLGTMKYMAPEQAVRPKEVSVKADVFSLGITLFELFTGRILLSAHHVYEIVNTRHIRASISGKLHSLNITGLSAAEEDLFQLILEMFSAASGRPSTKKIVGRFGFKLQQISEM